ncbi:hypothetical protein AGMMS49521_3990 [Campylobacterota bacterium]|nr:hypothetical protein AGMMS49521_3990 [Campylobacterota bacterium]
METKIPFYNLLNMFLIGLIFTGCCIVLFNNQIYTFIESDFFQTIKEINVGLETVITISFCAIIYEIGYVVNRIGSILEDILKKSTKILPFDNDYKKFNEKKKEYPILNTLSREYALSRTSMTLFLLLTIISLFLQFLILAIIMCVLSLLFYHSMRKHAKKIVNLMNA